MTLKTSRYTPKQRPAASARRLADPLPERFAAMLAKAQEAIRTPFVGLTAGGVEPGVFKLARTGVSTEPMVDAARAFVESLSESQQAVASFGLDDDEAWRGWSNIHPFLMRHGALLEELSDEQRELALGVVRASLSATGYQQAVDIMHLNETLREITGKSSDYGEWLYWLSIFGTPSTDQPWGWQIDGHHLIVNCLVLGDQVVMTPAFLGSEPTYADAGKYEGTRVFEAEDSKALALMATLAPEQRAKAIIYSSNDPRELPTERTPVEGSIMGAAFRDNAQLPYEGLRGSEMSEAQQAALLELVEVYVGRMAEGHAKVKMSEVREHLADTYLAWFGGTDASSTFYYRVHSPVVLIEFDHLPGIALESEEKPSRVHIHTMVRTPNGNDYGKDLLKQHYERHHEGLRRPG